MKFTNGYWELRQGFTAQYPAQAHEVEVEAQALTAYGPFKKINQRGDTLNLGLLTVRFSSPLPNVVRVQMMHHKGTLAKHPAFELHEQDTVVEIRNDAEVATLTSGDLLVRIAKGGDWKIEFEANGEVITRSGWRAMGMVQDADGQRYIHEQLDLAVGECVYGLGERFTAFVKNGQSVDMWNEDGGTSSELSYKNIPFYLSNRGYGVFVNQPERVSFEVASEKVERVQFSVPGESLDYFIIYGPSPKEVLSRYTALTGRPALPPAWSFGLWLSTSFTTNYDEKTVTSFIQGMADRALPLHVFHFDCFWMKGFHWSNLEWDEDVFPDPTGMLDRLHARGLKVCIWINPYIAQRSKLFDEGMEQGYLLKRPNGDVWQWDMWQAGMGLVDFTNPEACRWFGHKLAALVDMGVDCFKTDFGERIPTDVEYFDGLDPERMHNYYTQLYNREVFKVLQDKRGASEAVLFARSATVGGQQFPVHWGGDCTATFESMAESLRGGLSLGLSGFGFWSHDIGGFEQTASADVYKRWCGFGLLSSHSRLHGSTSYRVPWLYDDEAVEVLRFFTKLKCRLMPYLFGAACEAHEAGVPTMRAMILEFPDDPACHYLDRQYMLGESLLVAPILRSDGMVDYYVPEGTWTHFFSGEVIEGGRWKRTHHDFISLPLLVRPNSIIAVGNNENQPDYDYSDGVTLHIYQLEKGREARAMVPRVNGTSAFTVRAKKEGNHLLVTVEGEAKNWRVLLVGVRETQSVTGGLAQPKKDGVAIVPEADATTLSISLATE